MALLRLNIPGLVLYSGSIAPGVLEGKDITIQDVFEGVGQHAAGSITDAQLTAIEDAACPGAGACGAQYTANTMAHRDWSSSASRRSARAPSALPTRARTTSATRPASS